MSQPHPQATELLAPAGDWESLRAAVAAGADAVYFGLSNFNARHRATNFTAEELPQVIDYLHRHNVRGYVACNTLIFSDELPAIAELVGRIADSGADAVIVQDLGLVRLIRQLAPDLPIHGSTQMTLTEPVGIDFVHRLGVERVILARELSLDDIRRIRAATEVPVEVFVHGALCVAYSGQCLTSEALGGRSANRGQCAQACRLPYELVVDGLPRPLGDVAYLLSPQDLAAFDLVDQLVSAGVASLKIEGRLKTATYVALTTRTYRQALDAASSRQPFAISDQSRIDLAQTFSRGFSHGFLDGVNHQQLVHGRYSKSHGLRAGVVVAHCGRALIVEPEASLPADFLQAGDGVVLVAPGSAAGESPAELGGRLYRVLPDRRRGAAEPNGRLRLEFGREAFDPRAVPRGAVVWRTSDHTLERRAQQAVAGRGPVHRRSVSFTLRGAAGTPLELAAATEHDRATVAWPGPLVAAEKRPATAESVREPLGRLGDTPYTLGEVRCELEGRVLVPASVLNDLRRQAIAELERRETERRRRTVDADALEPLRAEAAAASSPDTAVQWSVLVRSLDQLRTVLDWQPGEPLTRPALVYCDLEDVRRYRDAVAACRAAAMPVGLATLRILKPGEEGWLHKLADAGPDAVLVRNLAALEYFRRRLPDAVLIGDFSLNAANELTADLLLRHGLTRLVPSYDLNWEQLVALAGRCDPHRFEVVVHQHMPMFHMEHCVIAHTLSDGKDWRDCGRPCDVHRLELRDRTGAAFPLVADAGCRNTVFNAVAQSAAEYLPRMRALGLRHFRVELLRESAEETAPLLVRYARVLAGLDDGRSAWRGLQVLNQLGVTRGTLQMN